MLQKPTRQSNKNDADPAPFLSFNLSVTSGLRMTSRVRKKNESSCRRKGRKREERERRKRCSIIL